MFTDRILIQIDGIAVPVAADISVAGALAQAGRLCTRRSVGGEARFAFCGMGYCQECRVTIDGQPHRLGCQVRCRPGMIIETGEAA